MKDKSITSNVEIQETPKICLIDVKDEDANMLKSNGFDCYSGTLGAQIQLPNKKHGDTCLLTLNNDIPANLHEYQIIVVDIQETNRKPYHQSEHRRLYSKGSQQKYFISRYPETLFDPRPASGEFLKDDLRKLTNKESILIVFAGAIEEIEYQLTSVTPQGVDNERNYTSNIYSFVPWLPDSENISGKTTVICSGIRNDMATLLAKHNKECTYNIVFKQPFDEKNGEFVRIEGVRPLMLDSDDRIVSYVDWRNECNILVFPKIKRKGDFLLELFQTVLPAVHPKLFPYSTQFVWLKNAAYLLPNEGKLMSEKEKIKKKYDEKIAGIEQKIAENRLEYIFLHDLLKETDQELVTAAETYFKWLGFDNVVDVDKANPELKEEDLRITLEKGLLIMEVKGIGGTSKDSECSQINKIKHRREKERNAFDVFALYLVNHQRYLPPRDRTNPPFNKQQIEDAKSEERGLLTTYQLFKLYFWIQSGIITKEDAREALLEHGLIEFAPSDAVEIGCPLKLYHKDMVGIFHIDEQEMNKGDEVIIFDGQECYKSEVIDMQIEGSSVNAASSGEVGIRFDVKVSKRSRVWIVNSDK